MKSYRNSKIFTLKIFKNSKKNFFKLKLKFKNFLNI